MRLRQTELTILIRGSKGGEIHQNGNLFKILLGSVISTKSHRKEDSMVVTRI
jgi:predicted RNA-binding protein with EMAP domain